MRKAVTVHMDTSRESAPVAHLVSLANQFRSRVYFEMDTKKVNAKSIMGMMTLGLMEDDEVVVTAEGADEAEALESMTKLLNR